MAREDLFDSSDCSEFQDKPVVSVLMITYNHERFIRRAIEGVLAQAGDFHLKLIIGEDNSTDNTRKICEEYAALYPEKVLLLDTDGNLGIQQNFIRTLNACLKSNYIAFCEGDDEWTTPNKLKLQVGYLEKENKVSAVAHNVLKKNLVTGEEALFGDDKSFIYGFEDLFVGWRYHTVSLVVRADLLLDLTFDDLPYFISCDRFINRLLACKGNVFYDGGRVMAVYNRHDSGASQLSNYLELRYQEVDMLGYFDPLIPYNRRLIFDNAKMAAFRDIALFVAQGHGVLKYNKFEFVMMYIKNVNKFGRSDFYYILLIIFGRFFYALREVVRGKGGGDR